MYAIPIALAATLLACGSSRPADSTATTEPLGEPPDAGVSLGGPSHSGDAGPPGLPPKALPAATVLAQRSDTTPPIEPDAADREAIEKAGKNVVAVVKLCVDATGRVTGARLLKSSGFPAYDAKLAREMARWTFRPIVVEGQPADVCSAVTTIFKPSPPPPKP